MLRNKTYCRILSLSLIFIVIIAMGILATTPKAYAMELNYDEYDEVFLQSSREIIEERYTGEYTIAAEKELLYDMDLKELGYIYDFTVNGDNGFSVIINVNNEIVLEEMFFGSENPFGRNCQNKMVYVSQMTYLEYADGIYMQNGRTLTLEESEYYADIAYASSAGNITTEQESIYYTSKTVLSDFSLAYRIPSCTAETSLGSNICVPVAGANIVQYYDRYCTDLIANYTPGRGTGSIYIYNAVGEELREVILQLYDDMETNTTGAGATVAQFKSGMETYCNRQGYDVTYSTCISGGTMSFSQVKSFIDAQIPVIVFMGKSVYTEDISNGNGYDIVENSTYFANHSIVAFGYKEIRYTFSDGSSRNVNMLEVATGISSLNGGYLNLSKSNIIDDAMAVIIE